MYFRRRISRTPLASVVTPSFPSVCGLDFRLIITCKRVGRPMGIFMFGLS